MSVLKLAARNLVTLFAASLTLLSVACQGGDGSPQYTAGDVPGAGATVGRSAQPLSCESGEVASCTIFLGRHGDLTNCVHGLDVCSNGAWTGCIDEETLSENPELYASIAEAQ